jgi:hypothetical protein
MLARPVGRQQAETPDLAGLYRQCARQQSAYTVLRLRFEAVQKRAKGTKASCPEASAGPGLFLAAGHLARLDVCGDPRITAIT